MSIPNLKWLAALTLAAVSLSVAKAEPHCPGNVNSVPLRFVNRYQMIVAVSVNHSGPYDFLLDTGTQITMIDAALATELHLATEGATAVAGAGFHVSASSAHVDLLEAGSHALANREVVVYDLDRLNAAALYVRGILGEDFLQHFDMLIDNANRQLCLDETSTLRTHIKGPHIELASSITATDVALLPSSLIVLARLSDDLRPIRLKLDSGTNSAFLYNASEILAVGPLKTASFHGSGADGAKRAYSSLPPQNVKIGPVELPGINFLTFVGARKDSQTSDFDGLLTLGLFRRVFICHTDHFAVLDPL
jgi:hypothetical protein